MYTISFIMFANKLSQGKNNFSVDYSAVWTLIHILLFNTINEHFEVFLCFVYNYCSFGINIYYLRNLLHSMLSDDDQQSSIYENLNCYYYYNYCYIIDRWHSLHNIPSLYAVVKAHIAHSTKHILVFSRSHNSPSRV